MYTYKHILINIYIHIKIHTYKYLHIYTYTYPYMHTHIRTYTHMHIHAHTYQEKWVSDHSRKSSLPLHPGRCDTVVHPPQIEFVRTFLRCVYICKYICVHVFTSCWYSHMHRSRANFQLPELCVHTVYMLMNRHMSQIL